MKKGDIIEGTVINTEFPNTGVILAGKKRICVKGTIEGQRIRARIKKIGKSRTEAQLVELIEPSRMETIRDTCPHFGECGGCFYSRIPYEIELSLKEKQVRQLFTAHLGEETFDSIYKGITGSPFSEHYRNKMEFSFGDEYKGGPLSLGMHKKGAFYDIVTVDGCKIVDDDFTKILSCTLEFFKNHFLPYFHRVTHEGVLRHLLVRKGTFSGQILVALITASGMPQDLLYEWKERILKLDLSGKLVGILHTENNRISDVVEDQGTKVIHGEDRFYEKLLGLDFMISPFSFFQTNSSGAQLLYSIVKGLIGSSKIVYDLYCGTGAISQIIADSADEVIGVEIVPEAVKAAKENANINKITNCRFICGDVLKVLDDIMVSPELIILDPPREGVHPKALSRILSYGVKKIIYISCKPTSLARDMKSFMDSHYIPEHISMVDMFPRTANIETVVLFKRLDS